MKTAIVSLLLSIVLLRIGVPDSVLIGIVYLASFYTLAAMSLLFITKYLLGSADMAVAEALNFKINNDTAFLHRVRESCVVAFLLVTSAIVYSELPILLFFSIGAAITVRGTLISLNDKYGSNIDEVMKLVRKDVDKL